MTFRKRRSPAPGFRQPSPFNPITGEYARIGKATNDTRLAVFQVVGDDDTAANADTHDDYVLCRGFSPEDGKFYDRIAVAKPYGVRGTNPYVLAQILICAKVRTRIGDTPGVSATTVGHPASLTESIDILYDADSKVVSWIEVAGAQPGDWFKFTNLDDATVPAFGIFSCPVPKENDSFSDEASVACYGGGVKAQSAILLFAINARVDVAPDESGLCSVASSRPHWALREVVLDTAGVPNYDAWLTCGPLTYPAAADYKLWPYLPGFTFAGWSSVRDDLLYVMQDRHTSGYAKAYEDWTSASGDQSYVHCQPCSHDGVTVYDGVGDFPEVNMIVRLPRFGSGRDPNVMTGNIIRYKGAALNPLGTWGDYNIADGDYLDDKIGTVKMWKGALADIPQGWREDTTFQEKFPAGVKSGSTWVATVGATGGGLTHTHGTGSTAGSGSGASAGVAANHLPPFRGVYFIERYK